MKRIFVFTVVVALVALALGSSASARNMKGRTSFEVNVGYAAFAFEGIGGLGTGTTLGQNLMSFLDGRCRRTALPIGLYPTALGSDMDFPPG